MILKYSVRTAIITILACMGCALASAQATNTQPQQNPSQNGQAASDQEQLPDLQHRNPRYQIQLADVLELDFPFTPEFNQTVTVQPDGFISLRGVPDIHVQGETLPQLTELLTSAYSQILHAPQINIELKDFQKPYFIVGGQVGHPGKYDLRGETTASEAVAIAGGFVQSAKSSKVYLFHRVNDGWMMADKMNLKKMLNKGDLREDVYLRPGDFIFVPQNTFSKIVRFIPTSSMGLYASPALH